jgi:Uma2 family endonuclease
MRNTLEGTARDGRAGENDRVRRVLDVLDARLRAVAERPHTAIRRRGDGASGDSSGEPDIAVVDGESPGGARRLLVIDVNCGTPRQDVRAKVAEYARAKVAEVWIVDVEAPVLEAHRRLVGDRYAEVELLGPKDSAQSPALGPREIALVDILRAT